MRKQDLDILQSIVVTRGGFGHREHLELVWSYRQIHDAAATHRAVRAAIRHLASAHGAPDKYHDTITRCWVHLVLIHRAASEAESFDEFIASNSGLLNRHLLEAHYSREVLDSPEARVRWAEPDLRDLPNAA
ncbi:MAG TPA: hypothetical protein VMG37_20745 [Solirubrobacteraceae bacterium]|nr:hypothetical protein [Solirubrobacteraceae bacterium]